MDCNHSTIFRRLHPPRPSQWPQAQSVLFTSGWSCPSAFAVPCPDLLQSFQHCSEHGQEMCDVPCRMRVSPRNLVQPVRPKRSMVRNCIRINLSDPIVERRSHSIRRLTPDHSCALYLVLVSRDGLLHLLDPIQQRHDLVKLLNRHADSFAGQP